MKTNGTIRLVNGAEGDAVEVAFVARNYDELGVPLPVFWSTRKMLASNYAVELL